MPDAISPAERDVRRTAAYREPGALTLTLPEPPSLNQMLELAKQRTRRSRTGGWMQRALPVVYDQHLEAYELQCVAALRTQRVRPPAAPWARWRLVAAEFRLHQLRDWTELLASLKWPVDVLVRQRFVADDSPAEMAPPPTPTQVIDRTHRGVTLTIAPLDAGLTPTFPHCAPNSHTPE